MTERAPARAASTERAFGFGRDRRVRKRGDFTRIQRIARRVTTRHYVLLLAPQEAGGAPGSVAGAPRRSRLGLIVTKKIGGAVVRNRVKRVCRECFRLWPGLVPDGVDLVVVARQGAGALGLAAARAEWAAVSDLVRRRAEEALARASAMPHVSGAREPPK